MLLWQQEDKKGAKRTLPFNFHKSVTILLQSTGARNHKEFPE